MTFKKWSLALFVMAMAAPLSASALGVSVANVTYSGSSSMVNGDTVTVDLLLENATNEALIGLDMGVFGYDAGIQGSPADNNLVYSSAQSGAGAFGISFVSGFNVGGLGADSPQTEQGFGYPLYNTLRTRLFGGISTTNVIGDGLADSGINGGQTNGSDVHLQVTFTAQQLGATVANPTTVTLTFGTNTAFGWSAQGPSGSLSFNNATLDVTVVPEPGTALLMGLGLAGLATARRR